MGTREHQRSAESRVTNTSSQNVTQYISSGGPGGGGGKSPGGIGTPPDFAPGGRILRKKTLSPPNPCSPRMDLNWRHCSSESALRRSRFIIVYSRSKLPRAAST